MTDYSPYLIILISSYFAGSVPTSYLVGKIFFSLDLRDHGSGNVGATNALRVLGKKAGILVLVADMGKGVLAVLLSRYILKRFGMNPSDGWAVIAGGASIFGHIYTVWLKFKGGKGVATSAGVFIALSPMALTGALTLFGLTLWKTRYVSLGSIVGALSITPLIRIEQGSWSHPFIVLAIIAATFIVFKHRANIGRLIDGTESKIGHGNDQSESEE